MTSITQRNATALAERNGTTLPKPKAQPRTPKAAKAEAPAPAETTPKPTTATAPTGVPCGCGCGETANPGRAYRPGHDARHAGQVGRWITENPKADIEGALAALPTPALQAKARKFAENRAAEATRKAQAAAIRAAAKAALQAELAAL